MRFRWRDWRLYRVYLLAYRGLRSVSRHQCSRFRIERIAFVRRFLLPLVLLGAFNTIWLQSLFGRRVLLSNLVEDLLARCRVEGSVEHHLVGWYGYLVETFLERALRVVQKVLVHWRLHLILGRLDFALLTRPQAHLRDKFVLCHSFASTLRHA